MITHKTDVKEGHYIAYRIDGVLWIEKVTKVNHGLNGITFNTLDSKGYSCTIPDLFQGPYKDEVYETWEEIVKKYADELI